MGGIQTELLLVLFETHGNLSLKVSLLSFYTQNGWWVKGIVFFFGTIVGVSPLSLKSLTLDYIDYLINNLVL